LEWLFAQCQREHAGGERHGGSVGWTQGTLRFLPPDELRRTLPPGDVVMVDEAAAIPVPLLADLLAHYPRMVFATTVHGYEGHGRGFALRFQEHLQRHAPGYRRREMSEPVRWSRSDALEPLVFRALLLDAEASVPRTGDWQIRQLGQEDLLHHPSLLDQVHGLLVQAHYRTTPDDLRVLLDGPNIRLLVACSGETVGAALLAAVEGGLPAGLEPAIRRGERRVAGHVLPQVLAAQAGMREAMTLCCWRVLRLAVHGGCRRQGLGSAMLAVAGQAAASDGADHIGSSFAAAADVARFWLVSGYRPMHLGWRRDSTTGAHALVVGKALSERASAILTGQFARWRLEFLQLLADHLSALEPALVATLLRDAAGDLPVLDGRERELLREFAKGHRPYETCSLAVRLVALRLLAADAIDLGRDDVELLVRRCLQLQGWQQVIEACQFSGKPAAVARLRALCDGALRQLP